MVVGYIPNHPTVDLLIRDDIHEERMFLHNLPAAEVVDDIVSDERLSGGSPYEVLLAPGQVRCLAWRVTGP